MNVDFYFVGSRRSDEDHSDEDVLLGSILKSYGILGNTEIKWIYDDSPADIQSVYDEIESISPRIIIALGSYVSKLLLGDKFIAVKRQARKLMSTRCPECLNHPIMVCYSLKYIVQTSANEVIEPKSVLGDTVLQAIKFISGELSDISQKELITALSYQEFIDC